MTGARCAAHTGSSSRTPPSKWVWNLRPECPAYLGYWVCVVCTRSGFDLRKIFCPFSEVR